MKIPAIFENGGLNVDTLADNVWHAVGGRDRVLAEAAREVLTKVEFCRESDSKLYGQPLINLLDEPQVFRKGLKDQRREVCLQAVFMIQWGVSKGNQVL